MAVFLHAFEQSNAKNNTAMQNTKHRQATPLNAPETQREWLRVTEACEYARVSKPVIYDWMNRGLIKSFSNRQRGQTKGARLISADSLRDFIESRATGGTARTEHESGSAKKGGFRNETRK